MDYTKKIADIYLPYPDLVLEEIFFIPAHDHFPGTRHPVTIADLAEICGRTPEVVWHHLHEIEKMSRGVVIADQDDCYRCLSELRQRSQNPLFFDVRFKEAMEQAPIPSALHLPSMTSSDWQGVYDAGQTAIIFSDDGRKAFSAAMWLRTQGRPLSFSVQTEDLRQVLSKLPSRLTAPGQKND